MIVVEARTLGDAWLETSRRILREGVEATYDGQATRELALVTLTVAGPDENDPLIDLLADPEWLAWMHTNFTKPDDVAELGNARSYGARLRDYGGRDYAHSLDFGKKAYGNLVELARLQAEVAAGVGAPAGALAIHVKSAHVYEPEYELMERLVRLERTAV